MKIVTINCPESYIDAINKLIGENGLYPSRSELIRVAVREFLLKELKMANNMAKINEEDIEDLDEEHFVRIPIEKLDENTEKVREFKTYKIVKRLTYDNPIDSINIPEESINPTKFSNPDDYSNENYEFLSFEEIENLKPSLIELRDKFPQLPDFKFINEV